LGIFFYLQLHLAQQAEQVEAQQVQQAQQVRQVEAQQVPLLAHISRFFYFCESPWGIFF
jgi:hypothetical protein